jgi:hypothetical protein
MPMKSRPSINGPQVVLPGAAPGAEPDPHTLGEPLSIRETAQLIGCSPWTVRQVLIPRGLPHFRSGRHGKLIFYRQQVIRWIVRRQRAEGGYP